MPYSRTSETSLGVAIIFSVVIFGIFYTLQGKGPESALLQFLNGLGEGNVQAVSAVVDESPESPSFTEIANLFYGVVRSAPNFWVEEIRLQKDECAALVRFYHPARGELQMVVFLRRFPEGWKVDAWNTLRMYQLRWRGIG